MHSRCQRCGRPLKDPKSRARGFGPTCYKKFTQERLETLGLDGEDKPMSEIIAFQYGGLDDSTREFVEDRTERIRGLIQRSAQDIVAIGIALQEVKERLPHGQFGAWLAAEFDMSERMAQNFMRVADCFKSANFADLSIAPSALYLLAAPSTPDEAREEAIERAEQGEVVSHAMAQEIVEEHKPEPEPSEETGTVEETAWFTTYYDEAFKAVEDITFLAVGQAGKVLVTFDHDAEEVANALGVDVQIISKPKWGGDFAAIKISALHAPTLRRLEDVFGSLNIVPSDDPNLKRFADTELTTVEYQPSAADGGTSRAGREIDSGIPGTRAWQYDPLPPDQLAQEAEDVEPRGDDTEEWMDSLAAGEEHYAEEPVLPDGVREQAVEAYGAHVVEALEVALHNLAVCEAALDNACRGDQTDLGGPAAEYAFKQFNFAAPHLVTKFELLLHRPAELAELREHLALASTAADLDEIAGIVMKLRVGQPDADAPVNAFQQEIQAARRKLERAEQARQEAQGL